jgi:hypothetical protein
MVRANIFIRDVASLENLLSEPSEPLIHAFGSLDGDILVLGVGGKMGPTLARMAVRASEAAGVKRRVIGVSRFSSPRLEQQLHASGVATVRCDLLDRKALASLPEAQNVVFMAGMKFGSTGNEWLTWAMNSYLPGLVSERFAKSRIVVFSTGNVYGLSPVSRGGSREGDSLNPLGEYAMSCLGRERIFEHFSRIAQRVHAGRPVLLSMGYLNAIWQADANAMSLQALACVSEPPNIINIAGPELLRVRSIAEHFGDRLQKRVSFQGEELEDALLSNAEKAYALFGRPRATATQLIAWISDWVARGGQTLAKPTHFEERAGRF